MARGRKSISELSVVSEITDARPQAPDDLTPDQAKVWSRVVKSRSADWFKPDSFDLLTMYCRHTVTARYLSAQIARIPADELDNEDWRMLHDDLNKQLATHSKLINTFARSMRLSQQSKYDPKTKGRDPGDSVAKKPWEK